MAEKYFFGFSKFFRFKTERDNRLSPKKQNCNERKTIYSSPTKVELSKQLYYNATSLFIINVTWANMFWLEKEKVKVCGWKKSGIISAEDDVSLPLEQVVSLSASWNKLLLVTRQGKCHVIWDLYGDWTMNEVTSDAVFSFGCVGESHCIAVDTRGMAYQVKQNELDTKNRFLCEPISLSAQVDQVSCGKEHVLLLSKKFGTIYSFGLGSRGQLGLGDVTPEETPKLVEALAGIRIRQVACGGWHSVALSECGDVYAWGWNDTGQLGITCVPPEVPMTFYTLPYIVEIPVEEWVRVTWIGCGSRHTAAMTSQGEVWTWGWGGYGQLGHGDTEKRSTPSVVEYFRECKVSGVVCGPWQTVVCAGAVRENDEKSTEKPRTTQENKIIEEHKNVH